jgi:DNA-binding MurR/RpiR family transcriptional regulator
MSVTQTMKELLPELTRSERKAAEYMISHPVDVVRYSSSDAIAGLSGCSRSAVVRLAKRLGFSGFHEFKIQLAKELNEYVSDSSTFISDYYMKALEELKNVEKSASIYAASDLLKKAEHIYCYGHAHSRYSAKQAAFRLVRNGFRAELLDYATGLKEYTGIISERDAILVFSISGGAQNGSPVQELQYFDRPDGPKIVLFTMTSHSPAEKYADVTVLLPCVSRMAPDVFIDDAPVFYMAIELLLEAMAGR